MEKSTFIYFSLGEFGRLEMFSLIARLGSAHLRIGGSCQWALRNVTLQEGILYCECLEEILAHGSSHVMQAGDLCCGAVAHGLMGARCGCGLGAGLGWAWGALVPSPEAGVPVPLQLPSCVAFGAAQATSLMERGSEAQPWGCWAGRWLRAEMLLSGFLSEQEM